MNDCPSGANRNCPSEPAAVARPIDHERLSSGTSRAKAARTIVNEPPASPSPSSTPPVSASEVPLVVCDISARPGGVHQPADRQHAPGAVAVGHRAGERLPEPPQEVLERDRERERLAVEPARHRQRVREQPEARPRAEGDQRDRAAGQDDTVGVRHDVRIGRASYHTWFNH